MDPLWHATKTRTTKLPVWQNKNPAIARENALQHILFLLLYWPPRLFKVNDFHVIWKTICDFLLVINRNLGLSRTVSEILWVFCLKNAYFSYSPPFRHSTPYLKMFHCYQIAYSCKHLCHKIYSLAAIHLLQTTVRRRRTNRQHIVP